MRLNDMNVCIDICENFGYPLNGVFMYVCEMSRDLRYMGMMCVRMSVL